MLHELVVFGWSIDDLVIFRLRRRKARARGPSEDTRDVLEHKDLPPVKSAHVR